MYENEYFKERALKKIRAYGIRKQGSKTIIELLDKAKGYSRKFDVLRRLAITNLGSERKFQNGLKELETVEFIKILKLGYVSKRIKLDERVWEREPDEIKLEHKFIEKRLNQSARWLNRKNLLRTIRNEASSGTSYIATKVHLNLFLSLNKHDVDEKGLIRLAKFRSTEKKPLSQKNNYNLPLFDPFPEIPQKVVSLKNKETAVIEDEIDLNNDEDIFSNTDFGRENKNGYVGDSNEKLNEESIDQNIFGGSLDNVNPQDRSLDPLNDERNIEYLKSISNKLSQTKDIDISAAFNELTIKVSKINITITHDPSRQEISATSHHKLKYFDVIEALRMFSKSGMISQLAIDTIKGTDFFLLRKCIPVNKYDMLEIMSIIERMIYEAIQFEKIEKQR
jgi:hypothetical protein